MTAKPDAQTCLDMFELGWFGQGDSFWRWIRTKQALPYVDAVAAMRAPIDAEVPASIRPAEAVLSDPAKLDELATWIEATFGNPLSSTERQSSIDRD